MLLLTMTVEAVPIVTLVWQHVFCGQPVGILLHPGLVPLGAHLLVELDQVVLHRQVQQPLGGLLVEFVVPVHVSRQTGKGRDLFLCSHSLRGKDDKKFIESKQSLITLIPSHMI